MVVSGISPLCHILRNDSRWQTQEQSGRGFWILFNGSPSLSSELSHHVPTAHPPLHHLRQYTSLPAMSKNYHSTHPPPYLSSTGNDHPMLQGISPRSDGPSPAATNQRSMHSNLHRQVMARNLQHSLPSSTLPVPSSHTPSPESYLESSPEQFSRDSRSPDFLWVHDASSTTSSVRGPSYEESTPPIAPTRRVAPLAPTSSYGSLPDTSIYSESLTDLPAFSRQVTPFGPSSSHGLLLDSSFPSYGAPSSAENAPHDFTPTHNSAGEYSGPAYGDQISNMAALHNSTPSNQGTYYTPSRSFENQNSDATAHCGPGSNRIVPPPIPHSFYENQASETAVQQGYASSYAPPSPLPNSYGGHIASVDAIREHSPTYLSPAPAPNSLYGHGYSNTNVANTSRHASVYGYSSRAPARSYDNQDATLKTPFEKISDYISPSPDAEIQYDGQPSILDSLGHPSRYASPSKPIFPSRDSQFMGPPTVPGSSLNYVHPSRHEDRSSGAGTLVGPASSYASRHRISGPRYGEQAPGLPSHYASSSQGRETSYLRPMSADISQFNGSSSSSKSNPGERYCAPSRQQEPQRMMQATPQPASGPAETFPSVSQSFDFSYYVPRRTSDETPMPHYDSPWLNIPLPSVSTFTNGPSDAEPSGESNKRPTKKRKTEQGPRFHCKFPGCDKTFVNEITSIRHMKETELHGAEKKHKCNFCDIRFARVDARRRHEKSLHADELEAEWVANIADGQDEGKGKGRDKGKGKAKDN